MLGEMRDPSYARINARHETPAFVADDGRIISETMAIAGWLEARDAERRISFDPKSAEADRMHQLIGFINTGFTGAFSPLWAALEMETPNPTMQASLREWGKGAVIERHDKLEALAGDGPYLVGDRPTLADSLFIGIARWLDYHEVAERSRWPKLDAIRTRLEADPAVIFATALENGETPKGSGALQGHVPLRELIERYGA
jgi:glutathione S-transferase